MSQYYHGPRNEHFQLNRRQLLHKCGMGMGALALGSIFAQAGDGATPAFANAPINPLSPKPSQFPGKAKRVIHIFANGGPSQVDTFDPKPALDKYAGKPLPMEYLATERKTGAAMPSPFKFKKHGKSGIDVSELFPKVAESADELCVIRSMKADVPNHEPSLLLMNCGEPRLIRPSFGSWVTYGLGSENQNLPGFVVLCPGGYPIQESQNWQSGFLPGVYQGTHIDTQHTELNQLIEHVKSGNATTAEQRRQLDLLLEVNRRHQDARGGQSAADAALESRIQSFELAYRMQMDAADAFDISREPENIRKMYGEGVQARQMLIARRLLERGVRFVQVWHGAGQPWDNHDDLEVNHRRLAQECDQPIGALLKDLKQRGMLDDTLVIWGGEFGRTPYGQGDINNKKKHGRDHHPNCFTMWMAGGGTKPGFTYGKTDDFGFNIVENQVHVHDLQATVLAQLGIDHERLTYRHAGRDFRLTDVHGRVMTEILS
jgi:hypothetical protein